MRPVGHAKILTAGRKNNNGRLLYYLVLYC